MIDKVATLNSFNEICKNTLMETLEIKFTELGDDYLVATMPVNKKVHQPYGILHGGASAALAESVGSAASSFFIDNTKYLTKGIEFTINHVKSVKEGVVTARATCLHKGRSTHLWEIRIVNEDDQLISICKLTNIILEK